MSRLNRIVCAVACLVPAVACVEPIAPTVAEVGFRWSGRAVAEAAGTVDVEVALSVPTPLEVSVPFTVGGTASGAEHSLTAGTVTIPAGQVSARISFAIIDDVVFEAGATSTIEIALGAPQKAEAGLLTTYTFTIADDDLAPSFAFAAAASTIAEADGTATIPVTISHPSHADVRIPFTVGGTATAAEHDLVDGTLTIAAGETAGAITIGVADDAIAEADRTVIVALGLAEGAVAGAALVHTVTIGDDEGTPALTVEGPASGAISENAAKHTFTLTLAPASETAASVVVGFDGTATIGEDLTSSVSAGELVFAPGTTTQTITIAVRADALHEADEAFTLTLVPGTNVDFEPAARTLTITDDDAPPAVSFARAAYRVREGAGTGEVQVRLARASGLEVRVPYTAAGAGLANTDLAAGTLVIPPGRDEAAITFAVTDDATIELDTDFLVTLGTPEGAVAAGLQRAQVILEDDDQPALGELLLSFDAESLALTDGDEVTRIEDAGSRGLHAVRTDDAPGPTYVADALNGGPALRFTGAERLVTPATSLFAAPDGELTIVAVFRNAGTGGFGPILQAGIGRCPEGFGFGVAGSGEQIGLARTCEARTISGALVPGAPREAITVAMVTVKAAAPNVEVRRNGANVGLAGENGGFWNAGSYPTTRSVLALGGGRDAEGEAFGFAGDLGVLRVYAGVLDVGQRRMAECQLAARFGAAIDGCTTLCADYKATHPEATDGVYALTPPGASAPVDVYCHDMDGQPLEYVTLVETATPVSNASTPGANCFANRAGGYISGSDVMTCFTKLRVDPGTGWVDREDFTFASSTGFIGGWAPNVTYASAGACNWYGAAGNGRIDLTGTSWVLAAGTTFTPNGWAQYGSATISADRRVVTMSGGGQCGWIEPTGGRLELDLAPTTP